jgi:hypothetical protein
MTPHPDTERLRYEIEAKTKLDRNHNLWPNGKMQAVVLVGYFNEIDYYNSQDKHIATFRLKAWK